MEAHNIREWIVWNHLAGVEHFVIFNNNDLGPDGQHDNIAEAVQFFIRRGLVTLLPGYKDVMNNASLADFYGLEPPFDRSFYESLDLRIDNPLKQRCWELYKHRSRWMAFFDTDEYFTPLTPHYTLNEMLDHFPDQAGVGVFWKIASYSGHFLRPADGSVSHYKLCRWHLSNRHIKTIAQPQLIEGIANAHYLNYPSRSSTCITDDGTDRGCNASNLQQDWFPTSRYFQLNHYFSRSVEEFLVKSLRGIYFNAKVDYLRRDFPQHSECEVLDVDEPTVSMARRVHLQMEEWRLQQWPLGASSIASAATAAPEGFMRILVDAVSKRRVWNETYYLEANARNPACLPPRPRDGLLHYWLAGAPSACNIRFD